MNFKQLEAFYWLAQLGNYQRVAERLSLTQPAVSARISGLEEMLDARLVERRGHDFALTESGHAVAGYAEQFLNLREAMNARLDQRQRQRLAIAMTGPAALTWGTGLRARLAGYADELMIDLHASANYQLRPMIDSGAIDIAFLSNDAGLSPVAGSFAVRYRVGWVARRDMAADIAVPASADRLRQMPLILYPRTSPLFSPIAEFVHEEQLGRGPRQYANSLPMIVEMLRQGFGPSAIPLAVVEHDIAAGDLVEIPTTTRLAPLEIRCVHLNESRRPLIDDVFQLSREAAENWCLQHRDYADFACGGEVARR
ncbi:LysR family transcriptional regulator [Salinicola rhizosphaerae]|uniref:LysR family transcriptional regulator n=1 Tax=Salinicola rhizosphaerae TaxID=1443141 RepID=A0ABQ3DQH4_9GAMM|nr:LysR family transcriptional regulator [Salinicola rhizosphaerae]GHB12003.1 LysR family transcriptional regulator [Salinicola rhizosphaerae]